ncbi:MAG: UDP-N-acetylmuramate dehydrogenase [Opitutales bacterium]
MRAVHLLGAGGMGMMPLGLYLRGLGFTISAEDDHWDPATQALLRLAGAEVRPAGEVPAAAELLVHSAAVAASHPSRRLAEARGLTQLSRGAMLAEVVRGKRLVAVAGSHGKTSATAMLVTVLQHAGFEAGWIVGGLFAGDALPPARPGPGDWVVAEIDESDGTIGLFHPEITLCVNIDWDHVDHYGTPEAIEREFAALFARTTGAVFLPAGCPVSARLRAALPPGTVSFTFGAGGDFNCSAVPTGGATQILQLDGRFSFPTATVRARGGFNADLAAAALAVAQQMGARPTPEALAAYPGVRRRQTCLCDTPALRIYEDYAHHPAEIRALLGALQPGASRMLVVFQPHRFTRTAQFKAELAGALALADRVFLLEVYPAGEQPVAGGTASDLLAEFSAHPAVPVELLGSHPAVRRSALRAALRSGDTLVFVGAGDIGELAHQLAGGLAAGVAREQAWTEFVRELRPQLAEETRLIEREVLGPRTTMRVGGPARVYAEPAGEADLQTLLRHAHARRLPVHLLGRGSNLLVPDEGVDGLVICLAHPHWQEFAPQPDGRLWAGAGLRLKNLCGLATKAGLAGFEFLEGIPASVGGALRMNAGAMGGWTFEVVDEVHLMTLAGERRVLKKSAMHVDYRHCAELDQAVALGAFLRPKSAGDAAAIRAQVEAYQRKRQATQPREPSAGCIFKNPPGTSAGRLIDESGLKGERVGDAEVSAVHANFIINRGAATCADILALIRRVRARVRETRGLDLEPEVLLFGQNWEDVL